MAGVIKRGIDLWSRQREKLLMVGVIFLAALMQLNYFGLHRFHVDEGLYASWAYRIYDRLDLFLNGSPGVDKPPLLLYLQAISYAVFGFSENAARLPNFIAGLVSVFLTYLLGKQYSSPRVGLVGALLLAVSPLHVAFADTAFTDMTMLAFAMASLCFIPAKKYLWSGVFLGLSFATKQFGILFLPLGVFLIVIQGPAVFSLANPETKKNLLAFGTGLLWVLAGLLVMTFFSNPRFGFLFPPNPRSSPLAGDTLQLFRAWLAEYQKIYTFKWLMWGSLLGFFYAIVAGAFAVFRPGAIREKRLAFLGLAGFMLGYLLVLIFSNIDTFTRYALIWAPFSVLLLAHGGVWAYSVLFEKPVWAGNRNRTLANIAGVLLVVFGLFLSHGLANHQSAMGALDDSNDGIDQVARFIKDHADPYPVLLYNESAWAMNFYLSGYRYKKAITVKKPEDVLDALSRYADAPIYFVLKTYAKPAPSDPDYRTLSIKMSQVFDIPASARFASHYVVYRLDQ